jgi:hypothetical protein
MVCFWKWGHKWAKPIAKLEQEIKKDLELFGIYPQKLEVCLKCDKVKVTATTCVNDKPKTFIMPKYPSDEKP